MDVSEKITRFDSYNALITELMRDMKNREPLRCRYPVRFILLNNFDVWHQLAQDLSGYGVQPFNIEDLIEDNHERWITTDELCRKIKSLKVTSLVTPFSELVRFYSDSDFHGFFNEIIINTEDIDHPEKRIYIPLIGLQNRFSGFLNNFARIEESAPIWAYLTEEHKTKVFLTTIKNKSNTFTGNENIKYLDTLYDWLRFWKTQAPQEQVICSSSPINRKEKFSIPDNIFTFEHINNSYEYIESLLGVNIPLAYDASEENFWSKLLVDIITTNPTSFNLSSFVSSHFGFSNLSTRDLLQQWIESETTPYERWLLKNYFLSTALAEKYPYLKICFKEISNYNNSYELPSKIAERIFYFSELSAQNKFAAERQSLMKRSIVLFNQFTDDSTKIYIKNYIYELANTDIQQAIFLTTGIYDFEKELITAWYADHDATGLSIEKASEKYPDLGLYMASIKPTEKHNDNWYLDYLEAYRNAKLLDKITESIKTFISEKNRDENSFYYWYHSFNETHNLLYKHKNSVELRPDIVYWFDALGAEFLPFILSFFEDSYHGYRVLYSEITRCTIPSATAQNRFDNVIKVEDLDKIAHDVVGYKKNATLVKELKVLAANIWKIITSNSHGEHTIAIVSDHGLSCLSRLAESKKYDGKVEHDGRYINVTDENMLKHNSDYIVHINENDGKRYKVALNHSSLGRKPVHEVHGGCTPEEVLVPYIIITNKKLDLTTYQYEVLTKEINISDTTITVNVMPQPSKVKLTIDEQEYNMTRNGNKWVAHIEGLEEGEYKAYFNIPGGVSHSDIIKVNGTGFGGNSFLDF